MTLDVAYDVGRVLKFTLTIGANLLHTLTDTGNTDNYLSSKFSDGYYQYPNYLYRLFLQTFTEMALNANLYYLEKLPVAISNGLWKIVGGFDDYSTYYGSFYSGYDSDYAVLSYLAKNYSDGTPAGDDLPDGLSYNISRSILTASTVFTSTDIELADFDLLIKAVNASALSTGVNIIGNESANSLRGDSGAYTLNDGVGKDTLTGGAGNDIFICEAGNDIITDYATGDKIFLGADISNSSVKSSDVVFTIGRNIFGNQKIPRNLQGIFFISWKVLNQFNQHHGRGVSATGSQFQNSGVTAGTIAVFFGNFFENFMDNINARDESRN